MATKKIFLLVLVVMMISTVSAVPDMSIEPSDVDRNGNQSLFADQENRVNLTFVNEDSDEKIFDVSPGSSGFVDNENVSVKFSESGFNISAGENKTVQAIIETARPENFTDSSPVIYEYNTSEGLKTNSSKFPELSFDVETEYERTNISLEVLKDSFEAGFNESRESTFLIENTGSEQAYNVNISGEDSDFDSNDFSVEESDFRNIDFSVKIPLPDENRTESTNQTYTRNVTVSGANFESKSFQVEVFVPFKDYMEDEQDRQEELIDDLRELQEFCNEEENVDLPLCGGEIVEYRNNTEVVTKNPTFDDLSTEEILEIANVSDVNPEEYENLKNRVNVLQRNINELKSSVDGDVSRLNESQRQRYKKIQEALDERNERLNQTAQIRQERVQFEKTVFYGFLGLALFTLAGVGGVKGFKYMKGEEMEEFVP
jgi:hypothetical protein